MRVGGGVILRSGLPYVPSGLGSMALEYTIDVQDVLSVWYAGLGRSD